MCYFGPFGTEAVFQLPLPVSYFYSQVMHMHCAINQLPNLFMGTPRICNFILLLIMWVHSFSKRLLSVTFAEKKVHIFPILREKKLKCATLSRNPNPNFQSKLIR